jgi:diguanylate cyclase (GGDEF)-like protein
VNRKSITGFFNSLRWKLFLALVIVLGVSFGLSIYGLSSYQRKAFYRKTVKEAQQVNELIESALKYQMMPSRENFVDKLVSEMSVSGEYKKIILATKDGEVRYASDPKEVGNKMVKEEDRICIICHHGSTTPEAQAVVTKDADGETVIRAVNPIENEDICHGCHGEKAKYLGMLATDKPITDVEGYISTMQKRFTLTGLITLAAIFVGISVFTNRSIHGPLKRLVDRTRRIGEGDFRIEEPAEGKDELAVLDRSFNDMVTRINENISEIKHKNLELNTLYYIVEQISRTIEFDKLRMLILGTLTEVLSADKAAILTFGADMEKAEVAIKQKDEAPLVANVTEFEEPYAEMAHELLRRLQDKDFTQPEITSDGCTIYVPLIARDMKSGLLMVEKPHSSPFSDSDRQLVVTISRNVSVALENARLYTLATTDELTRAYTRRYFQLRLDEEIGRFRRYGQGLTLLMADLDRFKEINDTFGHPAGDVVLKRFCEIVRGSIREVDVLCRYGGEEFTIILPSTASRGAMLTAERIMKNLRETPIKVNGSSEVIVTVSIGVAICPDHAQTAQDLVSFADKALYKAKAEGRGKTCVYSNGEGWIVQG